ncbi:MAG: PilZ domain-containing protein [Deltaproteobacteria bacterium]|jgi:hypothetical protein|nr:PilZ domain-containing protein [Deltaproteobacteria bacterium]
MSEAKENTDSESRNYSRISCFIRAMYRKMSHPDEPQLCPSGVNAEDKDFRDRFAAGSGLPEPAVAFLLNLDKKLDRLIAQASKDSLSAYFQKQLVILDLSASGLMVQANDLQANDYLELMIFLGEFPPVLVSGVAQVLRPGKTLPGVGPTYAMHFTRLRENEREQIVRYVFKENRQRIRTEKFK